MVDRPMPGVATIPAGVPFVEALAAGLLAEVGAAPERLADALVLLPTRRACRLLAEAFLRQSAGRALLLPRIQPLGEIDADEVLIEGAFDLTVPACDRPLAPPAAARAAVRALRLADRPRAAPRRRVGRAARRAADRTGAARRARPPGAAAPGRALAEQSRRSGGDRRRCGPACSPRSERSTRPSAGIACSPNSPRCGASRRRSAGSSPPARPAASPPRAPCSERSRRCPWAVWCCPVSIRRWTRRAGGCCRQATRSTA